MLNRKKRYFVYNIVVLSIALILSIFFAEIFLRLNPWLYSLGYRPTNNKKLVYELQPGYKTRSSNAISSSQGLNDRYFSLEKPEGIFRIAIIGDSTSFGWKLEPLDSFSKVLERLLWKRYGVGYEVMNFSVPGYNTAQELELIKSKAIKFNPDMLILVYCGNDKNVCNYIQPEITFLNYFYNRSFFFHLTATLIDIIAFGISDELYIKKLWVKVKKDIFGMYYYKELIYPYPGLEYAAVLSDGNPYSESKYVPARYHYMLGHDNYKIHLAEIDALLKRNDIIFISGGFFKDEDYKINRDLKIDYICNFTALFRERGLKLEDVVLSSVDRHMNEKGHRLIAEFIYNYLQKNNLIPVTEG